MKAQNLKPLGLLNPLADLGILVTSAVMHGIAGQIRGQIREKEAEQVSILDSISDFLSDLFAPEEVAECDYSKPLGQFLVASVNNQNTSDTTQERSLDQQRYITTKHHLTRGQSAAKLETIQTDNIPNKDTGLLGDFTNTITEFFGTWDFFN